VVVVRRWYAVQFADRCGPDDPHEELVLCGYVSDAKVVLLVWPAQILVNVEVVATQV
jgi:hypothetical protein